MTAVWNRFLGRSTSKSWLKHGKVYDSMLMYLRPAASFKGSYHYMLNQSINQSINQSVNQSTLIISIHQYETFSVNLGMLFS